MMKIFFRSVTAVSYAAFLFYLSSHPWPQASNLPPGVDKIVHISLYIPLGFVVLWMLRLTRWRYESLMAWVAWGVAVLYGLSDEVHQSFVPGRDASAADWGADIIGAALGVSFGLLCIHLWRKE